MLICRSKGCGITIKSIFRDHKAPNLNVLDAIKWNTEVFGREGTPIDRSMGMREGDTIKLRLVMGSPHRLKEHRLLPVDFKVVSYSKDDNSIALVSEDGKQKYMKPPDGFIAAAQKLEKRQVRKQRRAGWENGMEIRSHSQYKLPNKNYEFVPFCPSKNNDFVAIMTFKRKIRNDSRNFLR